MGKPDFFDQIIHKTGVRIINMVQQYRWNPNIIFKLNRVFRNFRPDIIHSFSAMTSFYTVLTSWSCHAKFIENSTQNTFKPHNLIEHILHYIIFQSCDMVVGNSKAGLIAKNTPTNKSMVLYNGFDFSRVENLVQPETIRTELGIETPCIVGMVASLAANKDWKSFVTAARQVLAKRSDVIFLAVGGGDLLDDYKMHCENDKYIRFLGRIDDIESFDNICDIGVLASYKEGIPNSVLEFMALGKPVIVASRGGISELVEDGVSGFVINPQSPRRLAEKILYLLDNKKEAQAMGQKAKERIESKFSLDIMTETLLGIYDDVLEAN